jgi:hypothetical protein
MDDQKPTRRVRLVVPLDISAIEGGGAGQSVKVAARLADGTITEADATFDDKGQGRAVLKFDQPPGRLHVAIGPADAAAEELFDLQTLTFDVAARLWDDRGELILQPIPIPAYFWFWWLRWCRTFVIRGRVLCPDGKPVPGATVCAYDVDMWWWWCSKQQVGCAVTDATGAFEIHFRWCCGWLPWIWWQRRRWQLEPELVRAILPAVRPLFKEPGLVKPWPLPDPALFQELLDTPGPAAISAATRTIPRTVQAEGQPELAGSVANASALIEVGTLEHLRGSLVQRLPRIAELEYLRLWPWWPWQPWWDCRPDIVFRVTQSCGGQEQVIVDESCLVARWNAASPLDVTLVANHLACCIDDTPPPEGNCLNITHACSYPVASIGGNLSAPLAPAGFQNPGLVSNSGDRPFAGAIWISGDFGALAGADYYELEYFSGGVWQPLPLGTVSGFTRTYFGPQLPSGPINTYPAPFPVIELDGRRVIESRQHFEATNGAGSWEIPGPGSRWWMDNKTLLAGWLTVDGAGMPSFADGTYQLRVKSWRRVGDNLVDPQVLGQCGTDPEQPNKLVLTLDNRMVGPASGHPGSVPGHPVGPGTVHTQTLEPDTDVISVVIRHADGTETAVGACGVTQINATDRLRVDFLAHDIDGHLAYYTLQATYGENAVVNLLAVAGHTLTALAADFVGPTYAAVRTAGAVSPIWHGGKLRYEALASQIFPLTCCYQIELRAHKRTIVSCDHSLWGHTNYGEYSFMVTV